MNLAIDTHFGLKGSIFIDEGERFTLEGVCINFLMSPGLMFFAAVKLTNKVESLLPILFSATTSLSSYSLLLTIN